MTTGAPNRLPRNPIGDIALMDLGGVGGIRVRDVVALELLKAMVASTHHARLDDLKLIGRAFDLAELFINGAESLWPKDGDA